MDKFTPRDEMLGGAELVRVAFPTITGTRRAVRDASAEMVFNSVQGETLTLAVLDTAAEDFVIVDILLATNSATGALASIRDALSRWLGTADIQDGRVVISVRGPNAASLSVLPSSAAADLGLFVAPHPRATSSVGDYAEAATTRGGEDGVGAYIVPFEDRTSTSINRAVDAVARNTVEIETRTRAPAPQRGVLTATRVSLDSESVVDMLSLHGTQRTFYRVNGSLWVGADTRQLRARDAVAEALPAADITPLTRMLSAFGKTDAQIAQQFLTLRGAFDITPPAPLSRVVYDVRGQRGEAILGAERSTHGAHAGGDAVILQRNGAQPTPESLGGDLSLTSGAVSAALCGTALAPRVLIDGRRVLRGVATSGRELQLDLNGAVFSAHAFIAESALSGELVAMTSAGVFEVTHVHQSGLLSLRPWAGDLNDFFLLPNIAVTRGGAQFAPPPALDGRTQLLPKGEQVDVMLLVGRFTSAATQTLVHISNPPDDQVVRLTVLGTDRALSTDIDDDFRSRALRSATGNTPLAPLSLGDIHSGFGRVTPAPDGRVTGSGAATRETVLRGGRNVALPNATLDPEKLAALGTFLTATSTAGPGQVVRDFLTFGAHSQRAALDQAVAALTGNTYTVAVHPDDNDAEDPAALRALYAEMLELLPSSPLRVSADVTAARGNALAFQCARALSPFDCGRQFTLSTDVASFVGRLMVVSGTRAVFHVDTIEALSGTFTLQPHIGRQCGAPATRVDTTDWRVSYAGGKARITTQPPTVEVSSVVVDDARGNARRALRVSAARLNDALVRKAASLCSLSVPLLPAAAEAVRQFALSAYPGRVRSYLSTDAVQEYAGLNVGEAAGEPALPIDVLDVLRTTGGTCMIRTLMELIRYNTIEMPTPTAPSNATPPNDPLCSAALNGPVPFDVASAELLLAPASSAAARLSRAIMGTTDFVGSAARHVNTTWLTRLATLSDEFTNAERVAADSFLREIVCAGGTVVVADVGDERTFSTTDSLTDEEVAGNLQLHIAPAGAAPLVLSLRGATVTLGATARAVDMDALYRVEGVHVASSPGSALPVVSNAAPGLVPLLTASGTVTFVRAEAEAVVYRYAGNMYRTPYATSMTLLVADDGAPDGAALTTYPVKFRTSEVELPGFMFYPPNGPALPQLTVAPAAYRLIGSEETRMVMDSLGASSHWHGRGALCMLTHEVGDAGSASLIAQGQSDVTRVQSGARSALRPLRVETLGAQGAVAGMTVTTSAPNTSALDVAVTSATTYATAAHRGLHAYGGATVAPEPRTSDRLLYTLREGMTGIVSEAAEYDRLYSVAAKFTGPTALFIGDASPDSAPAPARLSVNHPLSRAQLWVSGYGIESSVQYDVHGQGTTGTLTTSAAREDEDSLSYATSIYGLLSVNGVLSLSGDGRQSRAAYHNVGGSAAISGVQGHVNPIIAPRAGGATAHAHPNATNADILPTDVQGLYSGLGVFTSDGTSVLSDIANSALTRALPPPNASCPDVRLFLPHAAQQLGERTALLRLTDIVTSDANRLTSVTDPALSQPALGYQRRVPSAFVGRSTLEPKTGLLRIGYIPADSGTSDMIVLFYSRPYFDFGESVVGRSVRLSLSETVGSQVLSTPTVDGIIAAVNTYTLSGAGDYVRVMLAPPPQRNFIAQDPSIGVRTSQSRWYNVGATRTLGLSALTVSAAMPPVAGARVTADLLVHGREWSLNAFRVNVSDRLRVLNADGATQITLNGNTISAAGDLNVYANGTLDLSGDNVTVNGRQLGTIHVGVNVTTLLRSAYAAEPDKTTPGAYGITRRPALFTRTQEDWFYNGEPAPSTDRVPSTELVAPHVPRTQVGELQGVRLAWDYGAQSVPDIYADAQVRVVVQLELNRGLVPAGSRVYVYGTVTDNLLGLAWDIRGTYVTTQGNLYGGDSFTLTVSLQASDIPDDVIAAGIRVSGSDVHGLIVGAVGGRVVDDAATARNAEIVDAYEARLQLEMDIASEAATSDVTSVAQAEWDAYVERVEAARAFDTDLEQAASDVYMDQYDEYVSRYEEAAAFLETVYQVLGDHSLSGVSENLDASVDYALEHDRALANAGIDEADVVHAEYVVDSYEEYGSVLEWALDWGVPPADEAEILDAALAEAGFDGYEEWYDLQSSPYDTASSTPDPAWLADNGYTTDESSFDANARARTEAAIAEEYAIDVRDLRHIVAGNVVAHTVLPQTPCFLLGDATMTGMTRRVGVLTNDGWCDWYGVRTISRRHGVALDFAGSELVGNPDGTSSTYYPLTSILSALRYPIIKVPYTMQVVGVSVTPVLHGPNDANAHVGTYTRAASSWAFAPQPRTVMGRDADGFNGDTVLSVDKWEMSGAPTSVLRGWRVISSTPSGGTGDYASTVSYHTVTGYDVSELVTHTAGPSINVITDLQSPTGYARGQLDTAASRAVKLQLDFDVEAVFALLGACHPLNVPATMLIPAFSNALATKNYAAIDALLPHELRIAFRIDIALRPRSTSGGNEIEG